MDKPRKPHQDREKEILLAAAAIEKGRSKIGETKVSISAVARELGISPALIHNHYPKRGTIRDVYVSRKFLLQVDQYITQHRGERCSLGAGDSGRLFLNQNGQPYANEGKGLEKIVRDIGKKIGLDVHPHMLRHSYATHTLISLQRSRLDLDPLIYLSSQLGHSSIETTRIYLHIANDYVDNAVLQYDDELNEIGSADG